MKFFRINLGPVCLFSLALIALPGTAQETQSPSISTERPTVGNSPDLIPGGSLQLENGTGVSFQRTQYVADLPETLLRLGLSERLEVRFLVSDEVYQKTAAPHEPSLQSMDPALSVKAAVGEANQLRPRSAILSLSLPTGGQSWTSGSYDPGLTAIWTQTIRKKYFLNEVAGATLTTLDGGRRAFWAPSVAGGRSLTDAVSVFGEYAPSVLPDHTTEYVIDGGFAIIRKRLTQIDVRAGYLKDDAGYHTLISVGYSFRRDGFVPGFTHSERQ